MRGVRSHAECGTCVKHKLLLRSLSGHIYARQRQQQEFQDHLHSQYCDRLTYWGQRGVSRSGGMQILAIIDGMDQSKFAFPRHRVMKSKDFSTFQRPKCHLIGCICHGYGIWFYITDADIPKDSSTHVEIVANLLTRLKALGVPLRDVALTIQCDNTVRECKNNIMLSFLGSLVSKGCFGLEILQLQVLL